jgi:hypothetical protein
MRRTFFTRAVLLAVGMLSGAGLVPCAQAQAPGFERVAPSTPLPDSLISVSPIFSQLVVVGMPSQFRVVHEETKGVSYIREAVLAGETVEKWTQMLTVTGAKGLAGMAGLTPRRVVGGMAAGFQRACPGSFKAEQVVDSKLPAGQPLFVAVVGCGNSKTASGATSEVALIAAIQGKTDYYTLQWAERGAPSDAPIATDTALWVGRFKALFPIKLCDPVPGEAAPYPSCVGTGAAP